MDPNDMRRSSSGNIINTNGSFVSPSSQQLPLAMGSGQQVSPSFVALPSPQQLPTAMRPGQHNSPSHIVSPSFQQLLTQIGPGKHANQPFIVRPPSQQPLAAMGSGQQIVSPLIVTPQAQQLPIQMGSGQQSNQPLIVRPPSQQPPTVMGPGQHVNETLMAAPSSQLLPPAVGSGQHVIPPPIVPPQPQQLPVQIGLGQQVNQSYLASPLYQPRKPPSKLTVLECRLEAFLQDKTDWVSRTPQFTHDMVLAVGLPPPVGSDEWKAHMHCKFIYWQPFVRFIAERQVQELSDVQKLIHVVRSLRDAGMVESTFVYHSVMHTYDLYMPLPTPVSLHRIYGFALQLQMYGLMEQGIGFPLHRTEY